MKRCILFPFFALLVLVLGLVACGADEVPVQAPADTPVPVLLTETPQPPTATSAPTPSGGLDLTLSPVAGSQVLRSGFAPDPFDVPITTAGMVRTTYLGEGCEGYASEAASYRLNWSGVSDRLRIMFIAAKPGLDTMLIVHTPLGEWRCNDDASGTLNPMIELTNLPTGVYDIWVGMPVATQPILGDLRITQQDLLPATTSIAPDAGAVPSGFSLDLARGPNYGSVNLAAGFAPDPFEAPVVSGGTVNVASLGTGGCVGFTTSAPDFRLNWSGSSYRIRIMFIASAPEQRTALIVHTATGEWVCNFEFDGRNPMVEIANPPEGQYDIWVGSYNSWEYNAGVLKITEFAVTP